ncbi:cell division protein SepF [Trueperella bialowiezensis]|uniref:Cell division protein SepF n=1 Tax=Trueperella bialowiezensis TaxID=312285 RepID=A0A448PC89_9ACTO|nr:cell division protein SepF [Trueperella bialowiezensis]VEI12595.1 Cell division protein SepF [Trueperella bialowiezensis]
MGLFDRIAAKASPQSEDVYDDELGYAEYDDFDDYEGDYVDSYEDAEVTSLQAVSPAPEVARIVTVWVSSFNEVKTFASKYRENLPIVLNLSKAPDSQRNRIVDFALGLTFGLEGTFSTISDDVFLLTPKSVKIDSHGSEKKHY